MISEGLTCLPHARHLPPAPMGYRVWERGTLFPKYFRIFDIKVAYIKKFWVQNLVLFITKKVDRWALVLAFWEGEALCWRPCLQSSVMMCFVVIMICRDLARKRAVQEQRLAVLRWPRHGRLVLHNPGRRKRCPHPYHQIRLWASSLKRCLFLNYLAVCYAFP